MNAEQTTGRVWNRRRTEKQRRLAEANMPGKVIPTDQLVSVLENLLAPGDRVVLEGNNQKQADFLSRMLAEVNPQKIHDLHMIMPSVGRSEHLDLFEKGIARKLDFSFSGTQSLRISQLLEDGLLEIGAIHTYIELYSRLYVDLSPNVALIAGYKADRKGNLYTGPSTEDTPALEKLAATIPPMAYDVSNYATLGLLSALLDINNPDAPDDHDLSLVSNTLRDAIADARTDASLKCRLGAENRRSSQLVRDRMRASW